MPRLVLVRALAVAGSVLLLGAARAKGAAADLKKVLDEAWQFQLREDPLFATQVGDTRYNDKLPSVGIADQNRRLAQARIFLKRLHAIDRAKLTRPEQINYDIFGRLLQDRLVGSAARAEEGARDREGATRAERRRPRRDAYPGQQPRPVVVGGGEPAVTR